jgi:hypothetical protein
MTECCDEGLLRAYLEGAGALTEAERASVEAHLAGCGDCRTRLGDLRKLEASVMARLTMLGPSQPADVQAALQRMQLKLREEHSHATTDKHAMGMGEINWLPIQQAATPATGGNPPENHNRSRIMQTLSFIRPGRRRAVFSGLAAAILILSVAVFPSVGAVADSLLQSFRAKSVLFVPVDQTRLQQLSALGTDPTSLFLSKPSVVGKANTTVAGSLDEAAKAVGFTPEQPSIFPDKLGATQFTVHDSLKAQAQVNVATIRTVLSALNINDITLPDALGAEPISASVPAFLETTYSGAGYELRLVQGHSPTVTLPKGVDLAQLGEAGLRVIGMQPDQAKQLSHQIDWSSTLVVPFPAGLSDVVRVQVNDAQGLMVTSGGQVRGGYESGNSTVLYWQSSDRFFILQGSGGQANNDAILLAAKSVK